MNGFAWPFQFYGYPSISTVGEGLFVNAVHGKVRRLCGRRSGGCQSDCDNDVSVETLIDMPFSYSIRDAPKLQHIH
jgi:hypothetical protein